MVTALALMILCGAPQTPSCCSGMAQFANDPTFASFHPVPAPFTFVSREGGKDVTFKVPGGANGKGFFIPAKDGVTTGLLVFQEWWGVNDYIKKESEKLHNDLGCAVLAVDLYDGKIATTPAKAAEYMSEFEDLRGRNLVRGAVEAMTDGSLFKASGLGSIGWCFGGAWSQRAAIDGTRDVKACVMYYGVPDTNQIDLKRLEAPILMFWGTKDSFINEKVVDGFKKAMAEAGKSLTTHSFDAPHAFANPSNPKYDKAATEIAYAETIAFFKKHLR